MSKQFWGVIIAIIVVFVGIFVLTGNNDSKSNSSGKGTASQHVSGKGQERVTLVEYGDYQCPYCGQYYPILKQVTEKFNDQITFQFRNFPLSNVHQNAFAASRAAEAAGLQGKFWEMHDKLYENQAAWSASSDPSVFFDQYASQLGLNVETFKKDSASSKVNDIINADMAEGNRLHVTATPTFFLDGKKIEVSQSVAAFEKVLKDAIAKKQPTNAGKTSQTTQGQDSQASSGNQ